MKAVHSAKSTATLLQQAKEKIENIKLGAQGDNAPVASPYVKNEVSIPSFHALSLTILEYHSNRLFFFCNATCLFEATDRCARAK